MQYLYSTLVRCAHIFEKFPEKRICLSNGPCRVAYEKTLLGYVQMHIMPCRVWTVDIVQKLRRFIGRLAVFFRRRRGYRYARKCENELSSVPREEQTPSPYLWQTIILSSLCLCSGSQSKQRIVGRLLLRFTIIVIVDELSVG